ncbi:hypothetical protein [Microbacterium sp. T32]|uniref:hypothetical protein n=1 Tax=Microbacterium sp. T32 TaxID=1776083 RepID=UPI0007AB7B66|nr:hypothetical protein [Microbacterium sp. T32]KZE41567.1 hypothetical protein AVW09_02990 [Microbacterium sp. T32]
MSARLLFPDPQAAADLLTFSSRAVRLGDGSVRLRADGGVLVTTAAPLAPRGLLDATPTVLGLRVSAVDPELQCDLVVEASALSIAPDDASAIVLPDIASAPAWAGVSPPRGGWAESGAIDSAVLAARAQYGIAAVADALPADPGEDVVRTVRAQIWGQPDEALGGIPLGTAFAAYALGFIAGAEEAAVRTSGVWTRVTLKRGHVLVRGPVRSGLTAVRSTGR